MTPTFFFYNHSNFFNINKNVFFSENILLQVYLFRGEYFAKFKFFKMPKKTAYLINNRKQLRSTSINTSINKPIMNDLFKKIVFLNKNKLYMSISEAAHIYEIKSSPWGSSLNGHFIFSKILWTCVHIFMYTIISLNIGTVFPKTFICNCQRWSLNSIGSNFLIIWNNVVGFLIKHKNMIYFCKVEDNKINNAGKIFTINFVKEPVVYIRES